MCTHVVSLCVCMDILCGVYVHTSACEYMVRVCEYLCERVYGVIVWSV